MFDTCRHHTVFATSRFEILQAEGQHRDHAVVEQTIAASALAHLPSGVFAANAAWAVPWVIAHNPTRAAGTLASALTHPNDHSHDLNRLINVSARPHPIERLMER